MKNSFKVECLSFKTIQQLPDFWDDDKYKDLLEAMEYGAISEIASEELKEMCLMSLSDHEPEEAAKLVLEYIFRDKLTKGQIENLSNEMLEEKIWEEYADLSLHEAFFNVGQLLYEAYNGKFPKPDAVNFKVKVTAAQKDGLWVFDNFPEAPLIRLLVAGMPKNTLIFRLFEEQIDGEEFKDAQDIIWQLRSEKKDDLEIVFDVISSTYWFHDFKYVGDFEANTHADDFE